ncbi:MAG: ATP-binding protein [Ignavibacterium sp.]|jgi:PAS domain S-box-containing protein|nr:ATP-binding protein [Ignavibacterium sp.]
MPKKIQIRLIILILVISFFYAISVIYLKTKETSFLNEISVEKKSTLNSIIIDYLTQPKYKIEFIPERKLTANNLIGYINSGKFIVKDSIIQIQSILDNIAKSTNSTLKFITKDELKIIKEKTGPQYIRAIFEIENDKGSLKHILVVEKESEVLTNKSLGLSSEYIELGLIFLGLIIVITHVIFFQFIKPLSIIIKSIRTNKLQPLQKFENSKNEFGVLTNLIKDFFEQRKLLEEEVKVRKITQEELETLNDELEKRVVDRTEELAVTNLELQKERDQTKKYLDIAGTVIALLDRDGYIQLINKKGDEVLGYKPGELVGKNWYDTCLPVYEKEKQIKLFSDVINNKQEPFNQLIIDVETKGKEIRTLIFHITFLMNKDKNYKGVLFSAEDITELKQKEKELIEAKEKADESNKLKSTFLANMSHELRTPMIGILGYSDLLVNELEDDKYKKMASAIYESGQRLIETLNMILDLSRLEANKHNIDYQIVNVNSLIKNITFHFEAAAKKKNLFLKTSFPSIEIMSRTDPRMLRDVFNNLINNALKFTNKGGVFVSLELFHRDFIVSIKDTGIGITEENLGLVFEEFRQVSEGLGRGFQGTGLGLTICKKYVELLGGQISIKSTPGKGSEFTCQLPLFSYSTDEEAVRNEANQMYADTAEKKSSESRIDKKILIVEDDLTSREVINLFLKNLYKVIFAEDGVKAIEIAEKEKFDLILMDINLGTGITGIEVMERIRKIAGYEKTPMIAATAFAMLGDREKFLSIGFNHYISKPYIKAQLTKLLSEALKK